ncbi:unnamed protein product [Ixodes persulcatus]
MVFFDGRAFFRIHNLFIAISFDFLVKFKFRGTNFRDEKKSIDFTRPTRKPLLKCFFLFVTWFPPSRGKTKSSLWLTSFCSIGLPGSHSSSPLGNLIYLNQMFRLLYIYIYKNIRSFPRLIFFFFFRMF